MALDKRDLIMMGIGLGVGMIIFTALGRETMLTLGGLGKAEARKVLKKIRKKAEKI